MIYPDPKEGTTRLWFRECVQKMRPIGGVFDDNNCNNGYVQQAPTEYVVITV